MSEPESVELMKRCAPMTGLHYTLQFGELREVVDYIERLERDAARYRWLRDAPSFDIPAIVCRFSGKELDRELDEFMRRDATASALPTAELTKAKSP
jgi:hypothetical protein